MRLRDPAPPSANELIDLMPTLVTVETRFPAWLSLIADADNIARWHQLDQSVPSWRRILHRRDFGLPIWTVVVVVLMLVRAAYSFSSSGEAQPTMQSSAAQHVATGNRFLDNDEYALAVGSFDKALVADPDNASAYAGRAMSFAFLSDTARAEADLEKLESLAPLNPLLFRTRGLLARRDKRYQDAVAAYTRSLELDSGNSWTRLQRGSSYISVGELDKALADADALLKENPGWPAAHRLRARVFIERKETGKAKAEAEAILLAADKHGESAYEHASLILQEIGDRPGAFAVMQRAVTAFPKAGHYLDMSHLRPASDFAARRADIEAALRLEPSSSVGLLMLVELEMQARQWGNLIQAVNRATNHESTKSERLSLMVDRGIGHAKLGDMKEANADFDAATLMAKAPVELNNMCYQIAKNDVALMTALANCDRSLEQAPNVAYTLDSKAFTLMRLKRYAEALTVYDAAVQADAKLAEAWYGRGVVKHRLRNKDGGRADINAALALDSSIGVQFERIGLVP
jgi:tetratricopeptide (TPR) repeat protein